MTFTSEYLWLESYLDNDSFWLEDVLTWDQTFDLAMSDFNIYFFFTSAFFVNSHFFLDSITKMSFLDIWLLSESDSYDESREFFELIMWDNFSFISNNSLFSQSLYYTSYQDQISTVLHHSPELTLAFSEFINSSWLNYVMSYLPAAAFDVYSDSFYSTISQFLDFPIIFMVFVWIAILFFKVCSVMSWNTPLEAYLVRTLFWAYSYSRIYSQECEAVFQTLFITFLYLSMVIMTWDDDQEELIEGFNDLLLNFFLILFAYYILSLALHLLSFLEASISNGSSFTFILSQFVRDIVNSFAFTLSYLTLILRLNIYDYNDDMLDSYYVFLGDYDDDEYYSDTLFSLLSAIFFDTDNNDDSSFFLEDESDLSTDLFTLYFLIWGNLTLFNLFGYEEVARIILALFIAYLIVFEVHSLGNTYVEDNYFLTKRSSNVNPVGLGLSDIR